jgi:ABC-type lipoprotein release transport system permease subunit
MNQAVGLWVAAELRRRWPALVGIAVLVALAGGVTTALAAGARRADTAYERFREATGEPNLVAQLELGAIEADDEQSMARRSAHLDALDELAAVDGVESVEVESWWAIALYPEMDAPGTVTAFATGTFARAGELATPIVIDGVLPDADDPSGVTINEVAVRELGLEVGDTLTFATASPDRFAEWAENDGQFASSASLDGPEIEVEVAAVTRTEGDFEDPFPIFEFPEGFARAHADTIAHVEPSIALRVDPDRLDEVTTEVDALMAPYGLEVAPLPGVGAAIVPSIEVGVTTLWIATAVAAFGGLLLVAQALTRLTSSAAGDHPALAAMGLTRPQRTIGTATVAIAGVATGSFAVPLVAWSASWLFPRGSAALAEPQPGLRWDGTVLAMGTALTFVASALVLVGVAVSSSRTRSARAASSGRVTGLLSASPAMSLGASFAADPAGAGRRSRTIAGAAAASVAVAVAAVLIVTTLDTSRAHLEGSPNLYGAPAEWMLESNGTFELARRVDTALATPGVTALTRQLAMDDDGATATATGPGGTMSVVPASYDTLRGGALPPVTDGRHPQARDEVALGVATADALGAAIGDEVTVVLPGRGEPITLRVSGLVVAWDTAEARHAFVIPADTLRELVCGDVMFEACDVAADLFASTSDGAAATALDAEGFDPVHAPANVLRLGQVGPIPWLLAGFLCLFAAAGVLHAVLTSLRRRGHDLAIARALGLSPRRAAAALGWQAMLTAAVGTVAGLALGAIAGPAIWQIIAEDLGVLVVPRFPVLVAGAVAVTAVAAAAVLAIWPRLCAARLSPAQALRTE